MSKLLLVFGMPRSGTTWLGKLLDSHPDTLYRHEPDSVQRLDMPMFIEPIEMPAYHDKLLLFMNGLTQLRSPKVAGKQPLFSKNYHSSLSLAAYHGSVALAKFAGALGFTMQLAYRPMGSGYGSLCVIWKSIESSGRLAACLAASTAAHGVFVMRHPCGYVASVLRGEAAAHFGDLIPSSEDYGLFDILLATPSAQKHHLTRNDLQQMTPEERLAWRWVLTHEQVLADRKSLAERCMVVRYEDVCNDPTAMTHNLFDFAGLAWSPNTDAFIAASTQSSRDGYYSVFKDPKVSAERWQIELSSEVIRRIMSILDQSRMRDWYVPKLSGTDRQPSSTRALGVRA